jgi:hypothetical protein
MTHPPFPPHPPIPPMPPPPRSAHSRWTLPLVDHPRLELEADLARVSVVGVATGETPWLEVESDDPHVLPLVDVEGEGRTTRVRISGAHRGEPPLSHPAPDTGPGWWRGPWWSAAFWDRRRWKKAFHVNVVAHVPRDVKGAVRSNAAKMRVADLFGCDLVIETDAGYLSIEDVSGALKLATQAGRIDARRISGSLDIATSAGAVSAEVLSLAPGTHRIRSNVGSVQLELARGMPVRVAARTTMGATRVDFPTTDDAPALLDIEADLGAIRVIESSRVWEQGSMAAGPYRTPSTGIARSEENEEEIARILSRVADGSITPETARDLLRALGVT